MNFDLGRMRALVAALGHPEARFPAVHVAGTNGKGSVCAMMSAALRAAGFRTAVYTSPHLESVHERFLIDGEMISDGALARHAGRLSSLVRSGFFRRHPAFHAFPTLTQFEALTAIAFLWFAEQAVDIAVVEVGLGGRLDATNVLPHVAVSVITNIGMDHMAWLGDTATRIAAEKAGIVRPRTPVVTAATGAARAEISRRCRAAGAPLKPVDAPFPGTVGLTGPHQRWNAAVAASALRTLRDSGFPVSDGAIARGIAGAVWPGRFERFTLKAGQNRITVVLDGAHNVPAARALAATLKEFRMSNVVAVFGALSDKDTRGVSAALAPRLRRVITVTAPSGRAVPAAALARLPAWSRKAEAASLERALSLAARKAGAAGTVLVTGSLYVVGWARARLAGGKL